MNPQSRSFKLLTLAHKSAIASNDLTNQFCEIVTCDSIEDTPARKLFDEQVEERSDTKNIENGECLTKANTDNLQSALVDLRKEVQITEKVFEIEGNNNVLSSSFMSNVISNIEQINEDFDSFLFSDEMLNADRTTENNEDVAEERMVQDCQNNLVVQNFTNKDKIIVMADRFEKVAEKSIATSSKKTVNSKEENYNEDANIDKVDLSYEAANSNEENYSTEESDFNKGNSSSDEVPRKRKKRRFSRPVDWKYNTIKKNREKGLEYMGRKNNKFEIEKTKRVLKMRCQCIKKATKLANEPKIQCYKLTEEDRTSIFSKFWSLTWPEKKIYIFARVLKNKTKRARHRKDEQISQRTASYEYFLKIKNDQIRVCKRMFCNTLGVSMRTISEWIKDELSSPAKNTEEQNNTNQVIQKRSLRFDEEKNYLNKFFDALPKLESHYCRKSSTKLYLEPMFKSKSELYSLYKEDWCAKHKTDPLSIATFSNIFEDLNLALFVPKKDECDVCVGYKTQNIEETFYKEHITKKEEAREEKAVDKSLNNKVFTMDLQSVLLCPKSNVSAQYYRT